MLSFKSTIVIATAIIAGVSASKCLDDSEMQILLTDDGIWDKHEDNKGYVARSYAGTRTVSLSDYDKFADRVVEAFEHEECIKRMSGNKTNWEHAYPTARENIVARLYRLNKLNLLELDKLTDSACKEAIRVAGVGHPKLLVGRGIKDEPGLMGGGATYQLQSSQFKAFRAGCWDSNPSSVAYWDIPIIKNIPHEAFNDFRAKDLVIESVADESSLFSKLSENQVSSYISNPERCVALRQAVALGNLNKSVVGKYSTACLEQMEWLKSIASPIPAAEDALNNWVKHLNSKAFSTMDSTISDEIVKRITPAQAAEIDVDNKTEFRCSQVTNLQVLGAASFAKVDKVCLAGFLAGSAGPEVVLEKTLTKVPGTIFSGIPLGDISSIKKVLNAKNIKFLSAEHLKTLLAVPAACEYIVEPTEGKLEWSRFPVISATCWSSIPGPTREKILANDSAIKKLDEKILLYAEKGEFAKDVLVKLAKKRVGLIKHLGALVPAGPQHPCHEFSLENYRDDKEVRTIVDASNSACVRSLTDLEALEEETADKDFFKKLPPIIFASMDLSVLKEHKYLPTDFWSQMKPLVFEILSTPANCAELDTAILAKINPEALTALHWDCFAALKGEPTAGQVGKVPKTIFEQVDTATWPKLKHLESISTDQLALLSTKVTDPKKHAGTLFTDTTVGALSTAQVGVLNVGTVNALPDSAWKGFNPERFKALRPEVLVKVTCSKLKQVPEASLYELTAAQAVRLGEGISKAEESPRCVFTKEVLKNMKDPEAAKIMSGASQLVVSLLLVVASMFLGLWLA